MKNKNVKGIVGATFMLLMAMMIMQGASYAQGSPNARQNRIVGVWDVQVTNTNCDTGATLSTFRGLHKYELGGTGQVVPATNPTRLSAHMSVWNWVHGNDYKMTFKMFRFDAAGNNIGWIVVRNDVSINEDATEYSGSGRAELFDSNGIFQSASCPSFTGTRFQ